MSIRDAALAIAGTQVGMRETSRNSGPEVDAYLASVGLGPGYSWCAAFVFWCFHKASVDAQDVNPCPRTAGALHMRELADAAELRDTPEAGDVFVIDHGHGLGHVGFVESFKPDGTLVTVEGNTNGGGSREGDGVYRRTRKTTEINRGYLRIGA